MDALLVEIITSVIQYPGLILTALRYFVSFSNHFRRFLGSNFKIPRLNHFQCSTHNHPVL